MYARNDLDYAAHRAEREAVMAAATGDARAAVAHMELSLLHAARFLRQLGERAGR